MNYLDNNIKTFHQIGLGVGQFYFTFSGPVDCINLVLVPKFQNGLHFMKLVLNKKTMDV